MTRAILTLNAGSSSLKISVFPETGDEPLATGLADRIGPEGVLKLKDASGALIPAAGAVGDHAAAIASVFEGLRSRWPDLALLGIGHRVVHGGPIDWPLSSSMTIC